MTIVRKSIRLLLLTFVVLLLYHAHHSTSQVNRKKIRAIKSSHLWSSNPVFYPPSSLTPLPTDKPRILPKIQHNFPPQSRVDFAEQQPRRDAVKATLQRCWRGYREHAWLRDELTPLDGRAKDTFGGWAATMIDSLDTLWIMDLKDEFYEAAEAVVAIDFANTTLDAVNMFETNIRHLGGLLSAYDLSKERALLEKAVELGDLLYAGFDTPNRMPGFWMNFKRARAGKQVADSYEASASPCTISLEFTRLSQLTGDAKYYDAINRITAVLDKSQNSTKLPGMWPVYVNMQNLIFNSTFTFSIGASADSLYEYLPKMHALLGGVEPLYEKLFTGAAKTIIEYILFRPMIPEDDDILVAGTVSLLVGDRVDLNPEGEHLGCFAGGMFALAGKLFGNDEWVEIGSKATKGCIYAYNAFPHGVMPEIFTMVPCESTQDCTWDEELWRKALQDTTVPPGFTSSRDPRYLLRPEAIESVFILYRITGRKGYQDAAWKMFQAIEQITETTYGNAAVQNVMMFGKPAQANSMESFWLAETLKYFYLIFSPPDLISLDEYVFNTEAHPLKRPK